MKFENIVNDHKNTCCKSLLLVLKYFYLGI